MPEQLTPDQARLLQETLDQNWFEAVDATTNMLGIDNESAEVHLGKIVRKLDAVMNE